MNAYCSLVSGGRLIRFCLLRFTTVQPAVLLPAHDADF